MLYRRAEGVLLPRIHVHEGVPLEYQILDLEPGASAPPGWHLSPADAAKTPEPKAAEQPPKKKKSGDVVGDG
jgi:hypothetical protein